MRFERPLDIQHAGDNSDRIFVVEQAGRIYAVSGNDGAEAALFLDITDRVDDSGYEMGLLGLAFHPEYAKNGRFYVNYTDSRGTVIARYTTDPDAGTADPATEERILTFEQPYRNHNGGQLAFGPDRYLYIATGDGGSGGDPQGHGQNRRTLHGSILRINVDTPPGIPYTIPHDNPFYGNSQGYREEIYAYGLRNPWRFSFDTPSGRLWVADVGQNQVEEINLVEKGGNYGWNIMEGTEVFAPPPDGIPADLIAPVYEYRHSLGRSVTGGYVYRGHTMPELDGAYIYGDYMSGQIWALRYEEGETPQNSTLARTNLNISTFGLTEDNELLFAAFDGKIYRLDHAAGK